MRPCTGALIGVIIYSRTKEESCPAKPAARSFPYSTRRQLPARENHTDAKEPPFFCVGFFLRSCLWCAKGNGCALPLRLAKVQKRWSFSLYGCFFFGLAFGALKAMGILSPSGSLKSKSMGLFHCMDAFFTGLAFGALKAMGALPPPARQSPKALVFFAVRIPSPDFLQTKAALSRRKRRLSAGQINKITSRVQRLAFRSNSSSCWPVARSQAVNTPFSYSI